MSHSSQGHSKPAYYIEDCWISSQIGKTIRADKTRRSIMQQFQSFWTQSYDVDLLVSLFAFFSAD